MSLLAIKKWRFRGLFHTNKKNSGKLLESHPKFTIFVEFLGVGSVPLSVEQHIN